MRTRLMVLTMLLVGPACKQQDATSKGADQGTLPPKATPEAKTIDAGRSGGKPSAPTIGKEQRAAYRDHLRAGRKLARDGKWREAADRFDEAGKQIPMDARALSELGWAAFKAGDYDRALQANRDSVKAATEPRVKAASLYNLGRVAEARGDKTAAVGYYLQSMALRPNDAVGARLKALGRAEQPPWKPEPHSPCHDKPDPAALCACLLAEHAEVYKDNDYKPQASCEVDGAAADGYVFLDYKTDMERYRIFAARSGGAWSIAAHPLYEYNPGAFGIFEDATLEVETRELAGRKVMWMVEKKSRSDSDMGINEVESSDTERLTICVGDGNKEFRCVFDGPIFESYERTILSEEEDEGMGDEHTEGLPIRRKGRLVATLRSDGVLEVKLDSGQATGWLAPYIGEHKLF